MSKDTNFYFSAACSKYKLGFNFFIQQQFNFVEADLNFSLADSITRSACLRVTVGKLIRKSSKDSSAK
jgi:hypothetical protein